MKPESRTRLARIRRQAQRERATKLALVLIFLWIAVTAGATIGSLIRLLLKENNHVSQASQALQ